MSKHYWLNSLKTLWFGRRRAKPIRGRHTRLFVESLEDRVVPTITVTSNFDGPTLTGQTTLIGAILTADSTSGGDTIILPADTTFTLSGTGYTAPLTGNGNVNTGITLLPGINQPITIQGNGSTITLDSAAIGRFFSVSSSLTLNNLNLLGGNEHGGAGGGGFTGGGGGAGLGGAIFVNGSSATLTLNQASIANSTVTGGSGAYYDLINSAIPGDEGGGGGGGLGGQGADHSGSGHGINGGGGGGPLDYTSTTFTTAGADGTGGTGGTGSGSAGTAGTFGSGGGGGAGGTFIESNYQTGGAGGNGGFGGGGGGNGYTNNTSTPTPGNGGFGGGGGAAGYGPSGGAGGAFAGAGGNGAVNNQIGGGGAGLGGAIFNYQGTVNLNNVSLVSNSAIGGSGYGTGSGAGGAIFNYSGTISLHNATIADNNATALGSFGPSGSALGGGIYNYKATGLAAPTVSLFNTVLAANVTVSAVPVTTANDIFSGAGGTVTANGANRNFIGASSGTISGAAVLTGQAYLDFPGLFGGYVMTPPEPGSPLVGAGDPSTSLPLDEIGTERSGTAPTIGAYENALPSPFPLVTGSILVTEGTLGALIEIDPATGNRQTISAANVLGTGPALINPIAIAFDASGNIYVVAGSAVNNYDEIYKVDPTSGNRTLLSGPDTGTGTAFVSISGMAYDSATNSLLVVDPGAVAIYSVSTSTGNRTVLSNNSTPNNTNPFVNPTSILYNSVAGIVEGDRFFDTTSYDSALLQIASNGARTVYSDDTQPTSANKIGAVAGIANAADGSILMIDQYSNPGDGPNPPVLESVATTGTPGARTQLAVLPSMAGPEDSLSEYGVVAYSSGAYLTQTGEFAADNQVLQVSDGTVTELAGNTIGSGPFFSTGLSVGIALVPSQGPAIAVSPSSLALGTTNFGTASASKSYTVSGSSLTDNIVITPPTGVEVSLDNSTWQSSETLTETAGNVAATTIYVRISASASAGSVSGNITDTSTGATTKNISVTGAVAAVATVTPTSQSVANNANTTTISFSSNVTGTTFTWTNNNTTIGIGASGSGSSIASFTATNTGTTPVTATFLVTPTANSVSGTPVAFTITVNPTPSAMVSSEAQTVANNANTTTVSFSSNVTGTTYTWTNNNTTIGIGASGSGSSIASFTATNTGNTPVTATFLVTPTANGVVGSAVSFTITVNPTPIVTVTPTSQTVANNANTTTISFSSNVSGTTYAWTNNNTTIGIGASGSGSSIASFTATNSGSTPVTATFLVTPTANGVVGQAVSFTITVGPPAVITVSPNSLGLGTTTYGQASTAVTYTISGSLLTSTVTITAPTGVQLSDDGGATYFSSLTLTPTSGTLANTTIYVRFSTTAGAGEFTGNITDTSTGATEMDVGVTGLVNKVHLTVTANDASRTYGAADPTFTDILTGFVNGDTASVVSGLAAFSTPNTDISTSPVGSTYAITVAQGTLTAANYDFTTFVSATLSVTPAQLTVTVNPATRLYGSPDPTFTYTITGYVNGDNASVVSGAPEITTPAADTVTSGAGSHYTITATQDSLSADNYDFVFVDAVLTVTQAHLTVTANNASRLYGAADPTFTDTITGFVNGENASVINGTTTLTTPPADNASSPAGSTYVITVTPGLLAAANYDFTYVNGTLTVAKNHLTVTANNASRAYGAADPTFTDTITGLVNGDNASVVTGAASFSTPAGDTTTSPAGSTYVITAAQGTLASTNYDFTFANAVLTVTKAHLSVTANAASRAYGSPDPTFRDTIHGFVNGDTAAVVSGAATFSTPITDVATSAPGSTYVITITQGTLTAANYDFTTFVNNTLTVTRAHLTVTANSTTRAAGTADPVFTYTITGFVNGDTVAVVSGAASLSTPPADNVNSPVGSTYAITVTQGTLSAVDYDFNAFNSGVLSVVQANLVVTATSTSRVYGAADPTFAYTITGFINGDTSANLTTQPTVTSNDTVSSPVSGSPYVLTPSGAVDPNYTITYVTGALTITQAALTITANPQSKVYGAGLPTLTASYTGFVNGETSANLSTLPTLSTTATVGSSVVGSPYTITASGAVDSNYAITYVTGNLTVTAAPLTITANNQTKVYGQAVPTLTATYTGFVNSDTSSSLGVAPIITTTATAASSVAGSPYTITASGAVDANYTISYVAGSLTVTTAALTITADNQSKVYGDALPTLTATYSGFVNSDTSSNLTAQPTLSTTATAASSVAGSPYAINASGAVDPNYTITYVAGSLTVTKATLTITADNQTKAYGAALPTLTATYTGFVNSDTSSNLTAQPTLSTTATAASSVAGSPYTITATGAVDANYTISYVTGSLTVTAATLTITADNKSKVYGAAVPTLTASYTGFVNGDTSASLTTAPALTTNATAASSVAGSPYNITASAAVDANYTISYVAGSLTVTAASLTITANDQTKVYGAGLPTLTASYTGFVNSDTSSNLTAQPVLSTTATAASSVAGSPYAITASGADDTNYTISYVAGSLTITAAALTVTADNQTKVYGAALPTLTATYTGFVNSDTSASLTTQPTLTTTATTSSTVAGSPYTISASGAVDANYTISYVSGSLTVTTAALTITANPQTKVYGAALPTLTASYTGFVNGETSANLSTLPTLSTTATAGSSVAGSPYTITASGAVDSNYAITYVTGNLTVTAAPLTITANNQTKVYGQAVPTLTATYTGFVNSDTSSSLGVAPIITTTATAGSSVAGSPYTITASGAVDANYTISYVAGSLTVTTAALTITADNQSKVYGAAVPTLTATYSGFVNSDTSSNLTAQPTLSTTATAASSVAGSPYAINASGAVDANYTITYVAGSLTVTKATLTITADNQTKAYGAALPTLTATYTGFVNSDTSSNLTAQPTLSTTATAASSIAGSPYTITASGAVDANYTISYVTGSLTVTAATLTITADNKTKVYGAAVPTLTASYSGFVNGDTSASLTTAPALTTNATAASAVAGSPYTITASGAVDANYTISYVAGSLTVTAAPLTITANNKTKVYGAALPTLTVSYTGFVNSDTPSNLTTQPAITTTATSASSVAGSQYDITASGAVDTNYTISYIGGSLTVTKAPLTISADSKSKPYGASLPTLTASYSGFVNSDTSASLTTLPTIVTTATASSAVTGSPYAITVSGAVDPNYTISYVAGSFTVTAVALTITANNQSKVYGAALPALTATYAGLVNGDTAASLTTRPTLTTTATAASPVIGSPYAITASGAVDANYTISYVAGTLTVTTAPLTITANNQSMQVGAAVPPLTASYTGLVNGDTAASLSPQPTLTTTATSSSPLGTYPINISGAADPNYTISYVNGILTVGSLFADNFTTGSTLSNQWTTQTGGFAIANQKAVGTAIYDLATVNNINVANVSVQATFAFTATAPQYAGLVARYSGPADNNEYIGNLTWSGGTTYTAFIYRIFNGNTTILMSASVPNFSSSTGTLRFDVQGPSLKFYVNNVLAAYAQDSSLATGTVGIRVLQGSSVGNFVANNIIAPVTTLPYGPDAFNANPPGNQLGSNWVERAGNFNVATGAAVGQGPLNLAILTGLSAANVAVQANLNLTANNQYAGLVARYSGPGDNNEYIGNVTRVSPTSYSVTIYSIVNGATTALSTTVTLPSATGTWLFDVQGPSLKLFLNNTLVAYAQDSKLTTGTVGMRATSGASVDNFSASALAVSAVTLPFSDTFTAPVNQQLSNSWTEQAGNYQDTGTAAVGKAAVNLAVLNGLNTANVTVQAAVTLATGGYFGLIADYNGAGDATAVGYLANVTMQSSNVYVASIYRNTGTGWLLVAQANKSTFAGNIKLIVAGANLKLQLDNVQILNFTDSAPLLAGTIGMRSNLNTTVSTFSAG